MSFGIVILTSMKEEAAVVVSASHVQFSVPESSKFVSKLYGPPKRRKVSVIRDFPPGWVCTCTVTLHEVGGSPVVESSNADKGAEKDKAQLEAVKLEDAAKKKEVLGSTASLSQHISADERGHIGYTMPSMNDIRGVDTVKLREPLCPSESQSPNGLKCDGHVLTNQKISPNFLTSMSKISEEDCTEGTHPSMLQDVPSAGDKRTAKDMKPLAEANCIKLVAEVEEKGKTSPDLNNFQSKKPQNFKIDGDVEFRGSKLYGPPKRRKISAIRDFPLGLGTFINQKIDEQSEIFPPRDNKFVCDVTPPFQTKSEVGDIQKSIQDAGDILGGGKIHQTQNITKDAHLGQTEDPICTKGSALEKPNVKDDAVTRKAYKNALGVVDDLISKISKDEVILDNVNSIDNSVDVASKDVNGGAKTKLVDNSYTSAMSESSIGENVKDKDFHKDSDGDRKMEAGISDVNEVTKEILDVKSQESKAFSLNAKSEDKPSSFDFELRSSTSKSALVDVKLNKNVKSKKRKYHLEQEEQGDTRMLAQQTGENMNSRTLDNRLMVQALMAAPNCPWRLGRRSTAATCISSAPEKGRREKKAPKKKIFYSMASECPSQSIVLLEDQHGQPHLEDENQGFPSPGPRPISVMPPSSGSRELSVMVTPLVPTNPNVVAAPTNTDCEDVVTRNKVRATLRLFQLVCRKLLQEEESKIREPGQSKRIDLRATTILKEKNECVNTGKPILGLVPGVEIGDEFHYRTELSIVGLHRPYQGGIDSFKRGNTVLAISIVAGGSADELGSSDVLIYSGSGGAPATEDKPPEDQKLERGNLGLKNSIEAKTPVRVIRGYKELKSDGRDGRPKPVSTFTYDGLYTVEKYWKERVPQGFLAFKFQLRRNPGQPELAWKEVQRKKKSSARQGICFKDISDGKEKFPVSVVNTCDDERPQPFKYITKTMYPTSCVLDPPRGCNCTNGCSDSETCACAVKNGGEIPYNYNGAIVQAKPLIYECGPSCKCSSTCHNRVSQNGIQIQLEVFKTKSMGWGVRSLNSISSGSFICEYVGELLPDVVAEQRDNDEYLFDIGHNYEDASLWEDLPAIIPDFHSSTSCGGEADTGFTIDAVAYGNVGRFINHSCSPNLYAQNVLYDHDDRRMPHIMFFAAENIPPLQELTYHYNYTVDQVRGPDGKIKRKDCLCGSYECTGRLY